MTGITNHAKKRIRKRVGTRDSEKQFGEALLYGVRRTETKGDLRRYLDKNAMFHSSDAIVYKNMIYWHKHTVLITVIPLMQRFKKYLKENKKNEKKDKRKI